MAWPSGSKSKEKQLGWNHETYSSLVKSGEFFVGRETIGTVEPTRRAQISASAQWVRSLVKKGGTTRCPRHLRPYFI